ncbi:MAG: hypothetical protein Q9182_002726 [Xanthomendoza sp. 2 TL-2023]
MSCPLSAILNSSDESPLIIPITATESGAAGYHHAQSSRASSTTSPNSGPPEAHLTNHHEAPITFSPNKGSPHTRPASKKPDHSTALPFTPQKNLFTAPTSPSNPGVFNRLLNHPELIFETVHHLAVNDLLSLYSISRPFHALANTRFTTMILSHTRSCAPESAHIFPFRCYRSLCLRDPAMRPNSAKTGFQIRHVPGFQWLKMVLFRESVVDGIVACLEKEGLMLPRDTTLTIKKIWFFMDLPTNTLRDALGRNEEYWTEKDLYLANLFIMKLDMLFTCPMTGDGDLGLRKMLLGQRTLSTLLYVLQRKEMRNSYEMMKMIVAWNYERTEQQRTLNQPIFGVPSNKVGLLQFEGWGLNPGTLFHQIDEVLNVECLKRGLDMPAHYLDMVLYGFVDKKTGLDIWTREQRRKQEERMEREGGGNEAEGSDDEDEDGLDEPDDWVSERDGSEEDNEGVEEQDGGAE